LVARLSHLDPKIIKKIIEESQLHPMKQKSKSASLTSRAASAAAASRKSLSKKNKQNKKNKHSKPRTMKK